MPLVSRAMKSPPIPQLVGHRGYLRCYPENTWISLEAALDLGAPWLEFDIQLCRDGGFVLLHDDNFRRTAGRDQSVFALESDVIGISVHEPARFGDRFLPTAVVTLKDVLRRLSSFPGAGAMVELKQESIDHWGLARVMQELAPLLLQRINCVLISFNREALRWCRRHCAGIRTGWVLQSYDDASRTLAEQLNPDFLICNQLKLPAGRAPWPGNWQWMLYDIVDPEAALNWAALGIDLIETADIGGMLQHPLLQRRAIRHGL